MIVLFIYWKSRSFGIFFLYSPLFLIIKSTYFLFVDKRSFNKTKEQILLTILKISELTLRRQLKSTRIIPNKTFTCSNLPFFSSLESKVMKRTVNCYLL